MSGVGSSVERGGLRGTGHASLLFGAEVLEAPLLLGRGAHEHELVLSARAGHALLCGKLLCVYMTSMLCYVCT